MTPEQAFQQALALSKKYTRETAEGLGAVKGKDGFSPIIEESQYNSEDNYQLEIITAKQSFTTPNLLGSSGKDGSVVTIGANGNWYIDDVDTNKRAVGENGQNGITPHIDPETKHWMIGKIDTYVIAEGVNGEDGVSPEITVDPNPNEYILIITNATGSFKTPNLKGEDGKNGFSPTIEVVTDTETEYVLKITDRNESYLTPNLKPKTGSSGSVEVISSYSDLTDKPSINGVELKGDLSLEDLGINEISNTEIENIIKSIGGL